MASAIEAGRAFIRLSLNDSAFRKGLDQAAAKLTAFGKGAATLGAGLAGVGAALGAPLAAAVGKFASAGAELDDISARTGVSVEALSELKFAAEQSGASLSDVERGVRGMQKALASAEGGSGAAADALERLGLSVDDLKGQGPEAQFTAIAAALNGIQDPSEKAALAMALIGKSGTVLLPMIADMKSLRAIAEELGLTMSEETAKRAAALDDAFAKVSAVVLAITNEIGAALAPALLEITDLITRNAKSTKDWVAENEELIQTIAFIAGGLVVAGTLLVGFGGAAIALGAILSLASTAIGALGAVLAAVVSPVGLAVAAITGAVVAFTVYTDAGRAMVDAVSGFFGELAAIATETFGGISNALRAGDIQLAADTLFAGLYVIFLKGTQPLIDIWDATVAFILDTWDTAVIGLAESLLAAGNGIQAAWQATVDFFLDAWTITSSSLEKLMGGLAAFFETTWARIKNLFGGDATAEINRINEELKASNKLIDERQNTTIAGREISRRVAANQRGEDAKATSAALQDELDKRLANNRPDRGDRGLAAAEAELARLTAEASKAAEAVVKAETQRKKPDADAAVVAATVASAKLASSGTFRGATAGAELGIGVANETLKVAKDQLVETKQVRRALERRPGLAVT
jgi:hypothetical protein